MMTYFSRTLCIMVRNNFSISALSIGHCFGIIPAPGAFASSAFPVPPNKSSESASKISCAPPEMQTLDLGAESTRSEVPQLQGQKWRKQNVSQFSSTHRLHRERSRATPSARQWHDLYRAVS